MHGCTIPVGAWICLAVAVLGVAIGFMGASRALREGSWAMGIASVIVLVMCGVPSVLMGLVLFACARM